MAETDSLLLPKDMMFEILARTDFRLVPKLRCVCKEWRRLLSDPNFIAQMHHQPPKLFRGYVYTDLDEDGTTSFERDPHQQPQSQGALPDMDFMREEVLVEASTPHGLLLCSDLEEGQVYYVCKPTTREQVEIPSPNNPGLTQTWAMAVAPTTPLRFKIVRIYHHVMCHAWYGRPRGMEIFDSDSWRWKDVAAMYPLVTGRCACVIDGSFCTIFTNETGQLKIGRLNMWTEEFESIILPKKKLRGEKCSLVDIDGGLGLISLRGLVANFWKMRSWMNKTWQKRGSTTLLSGNNFASFRTFSIVHDVLFASTQYSCGWYNLKKNNYIKAERSCRNIGGIWNGKFLFLQSDYVPCNIEKCGDR